MDYQTKIRQLADKLHVDSLQQRLAQLNEKSSDPSFWDNPPEATKVVQEQAKLKQLLDEFNEVAELAAEADSNETTAELIKEPLEALERRTLLAGEYDDHDAVLSIYAGAGGTDAQDWVNMLLRLYQRYVERGQSETPDLIDRSNWKLELVELNRGEEAGIKSVTTVIRGEMAYGLLKNEAGVHRLVRLSPFNAKALRQTSFAMVDVVPYSQASDAVEIDEKELRVDVFRASGHGGQSVNTTDSAVRLTHLPTGITVSIQNERSQLQNKAKAMEILRSKLLALQIEQKKAETDTVRGEVSKNEWGSQIRSYILHPYKLVKDHRTGLESANIDDVLDGNIGQFIYQNLTNLKK